MEFNFNSGREETALTGTNEDIYPHLGAACQSDFNRNPSIPQELCGGKVEAAESLGKEYDEQPQELPITLKDLQDFIEIGFLGTFEQGFFSIAWMASRQKDIIYNDQFRSVIDFRTIEFMVRPLDEARGDGNSPGRIFFGPGDVKACLRAALIVALRHNPNEPMKAVVGRGLVMHPTEVRRRNNPREQQLPMIPFEWKVDRAQPGKVDWRVQRWRFEACGGVDRFRDRRVEYLSFLEQQGLSDPDVSARYQATLSADATSKATKPAKRTPKRPRGEMGASKELSPGRKRRSMDSQYSSGSQAEASSQSCASSPEIQRLPPVTDSEQPPMGPPAPTNTERPTRRPRSRRVSRGSWGSRSSRGSIGSATGRVGSSLADLTLQSPTWGSPEGVAPPQQASPWGGPPGVARTAPGQFSGYGLQAPSPGYQGPGRVQQGPGCGHLTDVYGHPQYIEPGGPSRPPRVGIAHTQFQGGEWTPPQPGQQQQPPAEQFPAQLSQQPGPHAGLVQWPPGSGYSVPAPSRNVHGGGGYVPRFPPAEPAMHGRGTHMPQYSRHMAAAASASGDDPSMLQGIRMTESPQLQPTTDQFGHGDIPSSFPSNVSPMPQSLPPPAMPTIDLSQLQAPRTVPPGGENYPSSVPATTETMRAELIDYPEPEHAPAESESESDGEDDHFTHQVTSVDRPTLYAGGHDNGRYYHSPMPSGGDQPGHRDPYWGGNESESESGDD